MQLREVHREEQRGHQLQHAGSGLTDVAEATAAIGLVLCCDVLVEIVAVGQDWRALAPRAVAPSRRHRVVRAGVRSSHLASHGALLHGTQVCLRSPSRAATRKKSSPSPP